MPKKTAYEHLVEGGPRVGTVTVKIRWSETPGFGTGTAALSHAVEAAVRQYLHSGAAGASMSALGGAEVEVDMLETEIEVAE